MASAANLIAFSLGITQVRDLAKIAEMAAAVKIPPYKPKTADVEEEGKKDAGGEDD